MTDERYEGLDAAENLETEAVQEEEVVQEATSEEVEASKPAEALSDEEEEAKARANGWDPSKGKKTAKEFNLVGEMIDLKKTLQRRDQDIEEILKYQKNVIKEQKINFRKQLEAQLAEARALGNVEAVEALVTQKHQLDTQEHHEAVTTTEDARQRVLKSFIERNSDWYNESHPELITRCNELDAVYARPGVTHEELAEKIEKHIRAEMALDPRYASLARRPVQQTKEPVVSSSSSSVNKSAAASTPTEDKLYAKLTANQKAMYNINKRISHKIGATYSVKEFLDSIRDDEEI